jgi:hypothetical protein
MRILYSFLALIPFLVEASVVGITTHPLPEKSRLLSGSMTGYLSERHEIGAGIRYTQELEVDELFDLFVSGAQHSREYLIGGGVDFQVLSETEDHPRISVKPFYQYQKFEESKNGIIGFAPTLRKSFTFYDYSLFPYLAIPSGIKIDSHSDIFSYYASLTLGASFPLPIEGGEKLLVSLETNKNMGASSDYVGVLLSWVWR